MSRSAQALSVRPREGSRPASWVAIWVITALLAACAPDMTGTVSIPTTPTAAPGQHILCQLARILPFTVAGDPSTSPPVWGIDRAGHAFPVVWPPGFRARFRPRLEVLAPDGTVIARGGDVVTDAGGGGGGDGVVICSIGGKSWEGG